MVRSHVGIALVLTVVVMLYSCGKDTPTGPSLSKYSEYIELARREVQINRNLNFLRPVATGILTRKQYDKYNDNWESNNNSDVVKEFKQIGFIPDTFSTTDVIDSYDDNFAAAFYVIGTDSLYVIDDELNSSNFYMYVSHELTHALIDQHFNPTETYPAVNQSTMNSDFYISMLSIQEGDASLSEYLNYLRLYYDASDAYAIAKDAIIDQLDDFYGTLNQFSFPRYLDISNFGPYYLGTNYVMNVYDIDGTWDNVNDLYHKNRVSSTADIITMTSRTPFVFDFSRIVPLLLKNTTRLNFADDDTYGPLMLMALLNEYVDTEHCKKAFGWEGDRLVFIHSDDQSYGSFIWALRFSTPDDAQYITSILDNFLTSRTLSRAVSSRSTVDSFTVRYDNPSLNFPAILKRIDNTVLWIENTVYYDSIISTFQPGLLTKSAASNVVNVSGSLINEKRRLLTDMFFGRHTGKRNGMIEKLEKLTTALENKE